MSKTLNKMYVYLKEPEKQEVKRAAQMLGLSVSAYIRMIILADVRKRKQELSKPK